MTKKIEDKIQEASPMVNSIGREAERKGEVRVGIISKAIDIKDNEVVTIVESTEIIVGTIEETIEERIEGMVEGMVEEIIVEITEETVAENIEIVEITEATIVKIETNIVIIETTSKDKGRIIEN